MNTRKVSLFLFVLLILASLSACAAAATPMPQQVYMEREAGYASPMEEQVADYATTSKADDGYLAMGGAAGNSGAPTAPQAQAVERMVIKNANLTIIVADPTLSVERIGKMAEEMGGYVVGANMYQTSLSNGELAPQGTLTIRVPVEKLDEALKQIKTETTQPVRNENISSEDVTSQYTDLESRLRNLEAAEKQLQAIMDQATKTEDVLSVYSQLVQVREQIEVIKGQMKYYAQSAALSLITVELIPDAATQPIQIGGWQPQGVAREALQDLINALQDLGSWLIRFGIYTLPLMVICLLPPALIAWGVIRLLRRRKIGKTPPPAAPAATAAE